MNIRDAQTNESAKVNDEGQLVTRSIVETQLERASKDGRAYSWDSGERDIDAGDTMLYIRNDSDQDLVIDKMRFCGSNVICTWEVYTGSDTTTPAGTTVNGKNLNSTFTSAQPSATAYYDETAVADGNIIYRVKTAVSGFLEIDNGIVLGKNHYVQFNQETESTSGSITVLGHYITA